MILLYALLLIVTLIWGFAFVAIKVAVAHLSPWELVAARFIPAGALFLALSFLRGRRESLRTLRGMGAQILLPAFLGVEGYNLALNWGETRIPAGTASLIVALNPLMTLLVAVAVGREGLTRRKGLGIVLGFLGLYVAVRYGAGQEVSWAYGLGVLVTLLAPLAWALYTVLTKPLVTRWDPFHVVAWAIALGGLPMAFLVPPSFYRRLPAWPLQLWVAVLFLAVLSTVLGFAVWSFALRRLDPSRVAAFVYLVPIWGLLGGAWVLGETLRLPLLLGAALVIGGVVLAQR